MNELQQATRVRDSPDFDTHIKRHKSWEGGRERGLSLSHHSLLCLCEEVKTLWGAYSVSHVKRRMQNSERQTRHSDPKRSVSFSHYLSHFIRGIGLWSCALLSSSIMYPNVNGLGCVAAAKEPQCCHWLGQYLKLKAKPLPQLLAGQAAPWGKEHYLCTLCLILHKTYSNSMPVLCK